MQFPIFLRNAMDAKGYTQQQLAELAEVDQGSVSRYLRGKASPKASEIIRLAAALEVSTDWLLTGDEPGPGIKGYLKKLKAVRNAVVHGSGNLAAAEADFDALMHEGPGIRRIPVLGWAHAGQAKAYEELPREFQDTVPTDCRDPQAFGVVLEGDSMEPSFREGDLLILMPGTRVHSGCLAVIRLADDGVLFRRIQIVGDRYRLLPLNPRYETEEFSQDQISWIYPVWGSWRQLWK